jgi:SAM-dependent methyltransferase
VVLHLESRNERAGDLEESGGRRSQAIYAITPDMIRDLPKSGPTDPIEFYRRPLVGHLFRERINRGLGLLAGRRFENALEVGYASGVVQLALAPGIAELHGIDLDADGAAVEAILAERGYRSSLVQGNVCDLPYENERFELVVSFSVFEHLQQFPVALAEVARVLEPGGLFLLGMPSVNGLMEAAFLAVRFKGIADHHVTKPAQVGARCPDFGLRAIERSHLVFPAPRPFGLTLYYNWLFRKDERADRRSG